MKINEPFKPELKSAKAPGGLKFRLALGHDREVMARVIAERNPERNFEEILKDTDREIALNVSDSSRRAFVAVNDGAVVGLCRFFHSSGLSAEKRRYPAPDGWYCMGLVVEKKMRRQGIARFLFEERLKVLKENGASTVYSCVDSDNLASVKMHEVFGFREMTRAPGFLHIEFDRGMGILFKRLI